MVFGRVKGEKVAGIGNGRGMGKDGVELGRGE